jgi:hypothetical protein
MEDIVGTITGHSCIWVLENRDNHPNWYSQLRKFRYCLYTNTNDGHHPREYSEKLHTTLPDTTLVKLFNDSFICFDDDETLALIVLMMS